MPIILSATNHSLQASLTESPTTQPTFIVNYADHNTSTDAFVEGSNQGTLADATADQEVLAAPASNVSRTVSDITIYNGDTASITVSVYKDVGGTNYMLCPATTIPTTKTLQWNGTDWAVSGVQTGGAYLEAVSGTVSLTSATNVDTVSLSVPAGTWDLQGIAYITKNTATTMVDAQVFIATAYGAVNTGRDLSRNTSYLAFDGSNLSGAAATFVFPTPMYRVTIAAATTYYCKIYATFGTNTASVIGTLTARRIA